MTKTHLTIGLLVLALVWQLSTPASGQHSGGGTAKGCQPNSVISTAAVLESALKATPGRLKLFVVTSLDATPVYAKLYNDTAANIDETDTPLLRMGVPAGSADIGGIALPIPPEGIEFSAAITLRVTTGIADNDTGALSANEVLASWCVQ